MAQLELRGPYHPLGPDSTRELEYKLNNNYAELCAAAGVLWTPLRLTVATGNGQLDSLRAVETKLNRTNAALAAVASQPAPPPVQLTYTTPSYGIYAGAGAPSAAAVPVAVALAQPAVLRAISEGLSKLTAESTAPVFTSPPVVSPATGNMGAAFSATQGTATGADSFQLRWYLNDVFVSSSSTYNPMQLGTLYVESIATGPTGTTKQRSADAQVVAVTGPTNLTAPQITGTAKVGLALTASTGTWSGSPQSYSYVWLVAGSPVPGASANTYTPTTGDAGKTVAVRVTATNAGGGNSATSAPTGAVVA